MYGLHGLNLAVPLLTLPVITRTLGPSEYGHYGVMLSWLALGVIFIDFGMSISSTKTLTGLDEAQARQEFGKTLVHQTVNALCVCPLLGALAYLWMEPRPDLTSMALMLTGSWSLALSTLWYRVARASVPKLLSATVIAKLMHVAIVLMFLPPRPTLAVALLANLASGFWPVIDAWGVRREVFTAARTFRFDEWRASLRRSYAVPLQRLGGAVFYLLPATLVASFFSLQVAGWYVLSDRIIRAGTGLFQPLTSTLFPLQLEVRTQPKDSPARARLRKYLMLTIGASVVASIGTFALARLAVTLIGGEPFAPASLFLRWMAPLITLITINMALTNQLYVLDRDTVTATAVWVSGAAFGVAIMLFGNRSPSLFAACCTLAEGLVSIWLFIGWRAHSASHPLAQEGR